ncbi:serine--tRNA ligase [Paenibacillus hemerocallicola]|uniref:Serine--tRNA ligase n=1 Tax=Paenibacillus hemerocallicola TaxID=1172614 RepID=A0A5C4TBF6_9BACL|nr:serine--tRNA ligase [Paenibacillus hemerocallicola]TNJ65779.1 serine--tRNA ligase [Paenibacillus hemerocallicola]
MLDMRFIRENEELLQETAVRKGLTVSVGELLRTDDERKQALSEVERWRQERNRLSERISQLMRTGDRAEAERLRAEAKAAGTALTALEPRLEALDARCKELMLLVPNVVSPDTPIGVSDADNVEIRRVGTPTSFGFEPQDHVALGESLGLIDIARGVKVAGSRNYYLLGAGLHLHRAVQQLAVDLLVKKGFTAMDVPLLVREETLTGAGFFPGGREQTFELPDDGKWLVGTSEASLVSYYADEIVDVSQPIRLAAVTSCFRREIGSAGRDVRGLYRVHQFAKVEQVVICRGEAEQSELMLQQITANAEELLTLLELPYRVVAVCTGDMGQKNYKQYDIETWMPSRSGYGETHSSSNLRDFQARRANIRYRDEDGKLRYCHTLNNTAVASPRILIPLLENHQREDGSVYIPPALRPYMYGIEEIRRTGAF